MPQKNCVWIYVPDYDIWKTECGMSFEIGKGTPKENNMNFCAFCGKNLVVKKARDSK